MSYPKNSASPPELHAKVVSAADGSAITSAVAAYVTPHGGSRGAGSGTLAHEGNGIWSYVPTQAETNYDAFSVEFAHASAVGGGPLVHIITDKRVDALNDYDGSDTSGTTTLLSRLTADRAGYIDKLNVSGTLAHSDAASMYKADVSGIPQAVWEYSTRTLSSFGSLVSDIADAVWSATTRTLSGFGSLVADVTSGVWSAESRSVTDKSGYALTSAYDAAKSAASQSSVDDVAGDVEKVKAAVYDSVTASGGDTLTLSNGATQVIDSSGNRTTTETP